ncbi:MAG TPA: translation initiation factor IF-2 [Bacteroidales bacterium]|nr:translation initiation factor IF-2 [Bacteroidales bacterium]HCI55645.1 translation initiation factor IF-2 [Bacteroidales bacterium]HOU95847.1 translation initiation factor IF-2 [Bacteroidales bacterium]HQG52620.1 translation initiation factor IF-2 [Bacteroidales bacterium]HQJ20374.1 translation initiation factor IF-2 [Bacteroidales bacterium]
MSEDLKITRLSKAAREFNVGISTIVEFLHKKGFNLDPNPNTKIPPEAYTLLVKEYSTDISVKKESERLMLKDLHKKKETVSIEDRTIKPHAEEIEAENEIIIKDATGVAKVEKRPEIVKPEVKVVGKIDLDKTLKTTMPKPEEKKESEPAEKPEKGEKKETVKEEKRKEKDIEIVQEPIIQPIESTKSTEFEVEEKPGKETEFIKAEIEPVTESISEVAPDTAVTEKEEGFIHITGGQKLTGPVIVGKIDLPTEEKKKSPAGKTESGEEQRHKRKRKRISKEKEIVQLKPGITEKTERVKAPLKKRPVRAEIDEDEVQKQIKETLARLTTKGKTKGVKYRREKREAISQRLKEKSELQELEKNVLKVTEFVSANELAAMMNVPVTNIISTCMSLGLFVSINQRLDAETMALVADEFGYKVEFISADLLENIEEEEDKPEDLKPRPPIVTVMGHVDHGKTKLLDYIRNTNVVAGEAGGITQHIGAYSVLLDGGRQITFLDTPGHEAFTAMRARGAQITDIAIIVVAADDGVMPQTIEAINHASAAGVPIIFAINKIDKPNTNPEKIKEELANLNYLVEDWGGKYQSQEISAKTGLNVDHLLEKVLLEAELLDLKANPNRPAQGTVIESSLDKGLGYTATVLVKNGTLRVGDIVLAGSYYGHIKALYNERGNKVEEAGPSAPVILIGLNGAPQAGDKFIVMRSDHEAKEIANKRAQLQREQELRTQKHITLDEIGRRIAIGNFQELNIIVKGDVDGSVEALSDSLIKLSTDQIQVNIIHKAVGQISESDVLLAAASNAIIVGFQVRPSMNARKLAEKEQIDIRLYSIIYDAIEEIKSAIEGMLMPEIKEEVVATLEVKEVFKITKVGTVAGCLVKEGKINRNSKVHVIRDGIVIYTGELGSLKRFKDDVKEVVNGLECGLNIQNYNDLKVGDIIEAYQEVEVKKTL